MTAALVPVNDSQSGNIVSLNEYIKDPLLIQEVILQMMRRNFLADTILRNAGSVPSGTIRYHESSPIYANSDPQVRAEFAEVQIADISRGRPMVAVTQELAAAAAITDEMRRRQANDQFQRTLTQIRNSMTRKWDRIFMRMILTHARVQQMAVPKVWDDPTAKHRIDILDAKRLITEASADDTADAEFGFEADTMILGRGTADALLTSDEFNKIYMNSPAITEAPIYRGQLDRKIYNLDVMVTPMPELANKVVICQRRVMGFYADELPLTVSEMYRKEENKLSRADVQRASAAALDQPRAVVVLNGISA
jgi:hypothetical protein